MRARAALILASATAAVCAAAPAGAGARPMDLEDPPAPPVTVPAPRPPAPAPAPRSQAIGTPTHGRLVHGVQLPEIGPDWLTWDPVLKQVPDRPWRRWGTQKLLDTLVGV